MMSKHNIEPSNKIAVLFYHMQTTYVEYGLQTWLAQLKEHVYCHSTYTPCVLFMGSKHEVISVGINVLMMGMQNN